MEGIKEPFYIRSEDEIYLNHIPENKEARFLAPLDNMLWDRDLIKRIFQFDYSWEVYVPESKRKYGYYVLPVLYGNRLVARFEPELQRNNEPVKIKKWWWEKDIIVTNEMESAIEKEFIEFNKYLNIV